MANETPPGAATAACFGIVWAVFITIPLQYVVMFWLLQTNEAPAWVWACFWVLLPSHVLSAVLLKTVQLLTGKD